jgi:hypothetical protein
MKQIIISKVLKLSKIKMREIKVQKHVEMNKRVCVFRVVFIMKRLFKKKGLI